MSNVLVVAEHLDGELKSATLATITFAKQAAELTEGDVIALVLGSGSQAVADEVSKYGVSKVLHVDADFFANYLAENYAPAVAEVARAVDAEIVCAAASTTGKDYLPRTAALLDAGMISDVIEVYEDDDEDQIAYKRPIWSGNLVSKVTSDSDISVVSVRTTAFEPVPAADAAPVEAFTIESGSSGITEFLSFDQVKSDRPALTDASVVIAGGRGLKSGEAFGMLEELADKLGAAVGASRAAVDSGYAPNDWQIGQTGKIIAPNLYVGIAISGAIQHLAGMKGSKVIVAINKDAEAPIFQIADFGLVEDAFKVVPELTSKL